MNNFTHDGSYKTQEYSPVNILIWRDAFRAYKIWSYTSDAPLLSSDDLAVYPTSRATLHLTQRQECS